MYDAGMVPHRRLLLLLFSTTTAVLGIVLVEYSVEGVSHREIVLFEITQLHQYILNRRSMGEYQQKSPIRQTGVPHDQTLPSATQVGKTKRWVRASDTMESTAYHHCLLRILPV